jgi:hypothetical protein
MDRLLRETFPFRATSRPRELSTPKHPERAQPEKRTQSRPVQTPIPPLLKLCWALHAGLLLVVIQQGCNWQQKAASSTPRIQTSLLQADASREPAKRPDLGNSSFDRVQTWVREDEPSIEITGPVFDDPFSDFAPRAVLERLPAPRAELVRLPQ